MLTRRARRWTTIGLLALSSLLNGCALLNSGTHVALKSAGLETIDNANAQIAQVTAAEGAKLAALQSQIDAEKQQIADVWKAQSQEASNHVFLAQVTYSLDPSPNNYEQWMHTEDVAAATTLVAPDAKTVAGAVDRIRTVIAHKDHQLQNQQAEIAAAQKAADQLAAQKKAAESTISSIKQQEDQIKESDQKQIAQIQTDKDKATKSFIEKQAELLNDKAFTDGMKKRFAIGAASLAVLAIASAVFSPVFKKQFVTLAIVFGAAAVAIPFVNPLWVGIGFAVGLAAVLIHMFWEHKTVVATVTAPLNPAAPPPPPVPKTP